MNQSELPAMTCNLLKAREKSRAIEFSFAPHLSKNWCEIFKPIIKQSKHNRVITFDGQTLLICK